MSVLRGDAWRSFKPLLLLINLNYDIHQTIAETISAKGAVKSENIPTFVTFWR